MSERRTRERESAAERERARVVCVGVSVSEIESAMNAAAFHCCLYCFFFLSIHTRIFKCLAIYANRGRETDEWKQRQCVKEINFYLSLFCLAGPLSVSASASASASSSLQLLCETFVALFMLVPHLTLIQAPWQHSHRVTHTHTRVPITCKYNNINIKKKQYAFVLRNCNGDDDDGDDNGERI